MAVGRELVKEVSDTHNLSLSYRRNREDGGTGGGERGGNARGSECGSDLNEADT
jgi:hypothetical protein